MIPGGASPINGMLSVFYSTSDDSWQYSCGLIPLFVHAKNDHASFKLITAQLICQGACRIVDVSRAFGVPEISLKRRVKAFREKGAQAFFATERRVRGATVMSPAVIAQAQQLLDQGQSRRTIATELKIGLDTLKKAIHSGRLQEAKPAAPAPETAVAPAAADSKSERSAAAAECPMGKACHREDERFAAALGQLTSASIRFDPARDLKYGGVLCALPALEAVGLFDFLAQHFTLPRGYYDVMHVVTALAFMALLRIKTNEQLRFEDPGELGRLLGLDRIPEVKTMRLKIKAMCTEEGSRAWMLQLAKRWIDDTPDDLAGFFYVDGHVRLYHGSRTELPRRFVSREKLCLRGITDYWVNDALGQPFFVVSKTINEGMNAALTSAIIPQLLKDVPTLTAAQLADPLHPRLTVVFDRESSGHNLFKKLWKDHRVACMSYQKNVTDKWPEIEFQETKVDMPSGEKITMKLAERGTLIGSKQEILWVKEIRKLMDTGHQTSVITTNYQLGAAKVAAQMFSRWSQENYFGYAMRHYNIDRLMDYQLAEFPDPDKLIINPERRSLESSIRSLRQKLSRKKAEFGSAEIKSGEVSGKKSAASAAVARKAGLREEVEALEKDLDEMKERRKTTGKSIAYRDMPKEHQFKCLEPSRKMFSDTIKMISYRSETAIASILAEELGKSDDARRLTCDLLSGEADLLPDPATQSLHVILHRLSNPQADAAIRELLKTLNDTDTLYPGTTWKLRYRLVGDPAP
jgi:transposase-like protein